MMRLLSGVICAIARAAARFAKAEPLPLGERVQCETGLHEVPLSAQDPPTERARQIL